MTEIVEVTARLGDTVVSVAHGARVTVGHTGDLFAPIDNVTFAASDLVDHSRAAGLLTLDIRRVSAATDRVPRKRFAGRPAAYIAISLLVHLALWGTAINVSLGDGHHGFARPRSAQLRLAPAPAAALDEEGEPALAISMSLSEPRDGIGPIADIAGRASVDIVDTRGADPRDDNRDARRASAIAFARNAGVLGADALRGEHPLGDIPGTGSPASGFDGRAIQGAARGESAHAFATERKLRGGCVGDDCGVIGAGRYGVVCGGPTPDAPCAGGYGAGYGGLRAHEARLPTIHICGNPDKPTHSCLVAVGDLDKAIVRRYIRRALPAIQYCYEKGLLANNALSGAVDTSFLIDPTGVPRDVTATGLDPDVASCVTTVLSGIRFPRARNGGSTQVHYPFSFSVAGS